MTTTQQIQPQEIQPRQIGWAAVEHFAANHPAHRWPSCGSSIASKSSTPIGVAHHLFWRR